MKSVLLVDDDANFRRSLALMLEGEGYIIYEAENGLDALEFLNKCSNKDIHIDCVILDARMPGLDGFWLADQIKSLDATLKIIILSAYPYPEDYDRYLTLTKPARLNVLKEALEGQGVFAL